ncbi:MAG: YHS domain-containing (seleno)protein [Ectothiorhodospiraceae bacterium]
MVRQSIGLLAALAWSVVGPAFAAGEGRIYTENGVALGGTDPVAYFEMQEAVQGSEQHSYEWRGAEWHFASAEHREQFAADPESYAPEYGGWCAWAAAQGNAASTTPEAWSIVDGKLYLNYSKNIHARWQGNRAEFIESADENWPEIF